MSFTFEKIWYNFELAGVKHRTSSCSGLFSSSFFSNLPGATVRPSGVGWGGKSWKRLETDVLSHLLPVFPLVCPEFGQKIGSKRQFFFNASAST